MPSGVDDIDINLMLSLTTTTILFPSVRLQETAGLTGSRKVI